MTATASRPRRYLVTGATGFLGSHLVARLAEAGHDVVALCRKGPGPLGDANARDRGWGPRVTVRPGDVLDAGSITDAAAGCDGLFHCAGKVSRRPEDAEALYRVHVDGTKITLDAAKKAGVRRVVLASTSGVVCVSRDPNEVRNEDAPTPTDLVGSFPYYRSKLYAERVAFDRAAPDFEVVVVNPTLLLGPGDVHGSSTEDVVSFLEGRVPVAPAGGLSFVDARDAAEAMVLAMDRGRSGERYLVAAANLTVAAFLARLERISGVPAPKLTLPRSVLLATAGASLLERAAERLRMKAPIDPTTARMGQLFWYVDAAKARNELGWTHRDPGETLVDTVADLEARGVVWPRPQPLV